MKMKKTKRFYTTEEFASERRSNTYKYNHPR